MNKFRKMLDILPRINIIKSLFMTLRWHSLILIGTNTRIRLARDAKITVEKGGRLEIGVWISYKQKTVLDIYPGGELRANGLVQINAGTKVVIGDNALLSIGNGSYINEHSRVQCKKRIEIGEDCAVAWGTNLLDTDEHHIFALGRIENSSFCAPLSIGNHVWVGCNSILLKGVTIGADCVVAAGSVVTKSFGPHTLIAGNPAKAIRTEVAWKK